MSTAVAKKSKVPIHTRQAIANAIAAAAAPDGGWGEIQITFARFRDEAKIKFSARNSAMHLKSALKCGRAVPFFGFHDGCEGSQLIIKKHVALDLPNLLGSPPAPAAEIDLEPFAKAIDAAKAKTIESIFEIGRNLKAAHDLLANHGNGEFCKWVNERCGFSDRTARNYMAVVEAFGDQDSERLSESFTAEALYLLSRDAVPEEAVEAAIKLAEKGEQINLAKAKEIATPLEERCDRAAEEFHDSVEEPHVLPLRKQLSIVACIERLRESIEDIFAIWPEDIRDQAIPVQLRAIAEEIEAKAFPRDAKLSAEEQLA